jgi:hypothetical protein
MKLRLYNKLHFFAVICFWLTTAFVSMTLQAQDNEGSIFSLTVEPVGFAVYPIPSQGAELDIFIAPDLALAVNYATGSTEQLLAKTTSQLALLRLKYFFGAISHVNLGIGYRSIGTEYDVMSASLGQVDVQKTMKVAVSELSFGNQISWGPLQFSCDWLGIVVPVAKLAYHDDVPGDVVEGGGDDVDADEMQKVAFAPTLQFVRFSVGVIF